MNSKILNAQLGIYFIFLVVFLMSGCATSLDSDSTTQNIQITLSGKQSVPPVATNSSGKGMIKVNTKSGEISGAIVLNGFTATKMHIHRGESGKNGKVVVTLEQDADNANKFSIPAFTELSKKDMNVLLLGGMYFQAHSKKYPKGEVRGQIELSTGNDYY